MRFVSDAFVFQGAMYTFPRFRFSPKALQAARDAQQAPDVYYCVRLVQATGIVCYDSERFVICLRDILLIVLQCLVPGSGFRQQEGTFHVRCTFLPLEAAFPDFIARLEAFHQRFCDEFK